MEFQSSFAYADDTLLYCTANSINEVLDLSQGLLIDAAQWYNRNLLTLNINKTQFCIFSNRKIKEYYHITHGNTNIESTLSTNVLGVHLDTDLSFNTHAIETAKKANKKIYLISKIKKYLTVDDALKAYKTYVRPILEYCSALYLECTRHTIDIIEKVQNKAIRIIVSAPREFSITTGRTLLNLPTLKTRRFFLFHKFVHQKVMRKRASKNILNLVQGANRHNRHLRSASQIIKPKHRTNFGKSALISLIHSYISKKQTAKELLSFVNKH